MRKKIVQLLNNIINIVSLYLEKQDNRKKVILFLMKSIPLLLFLFYFILFTSNSYIRASLGGFLLHIFTIIFFCSGLIFWGWMLLDCALNESKEGNDKTVWVLIILFTFVLGAILYFFARRPQRKKEAGIGEKLKE